jgi:nitroimidazol reductase NimA-like FMN-containing flavoprotein (pyridoxamine 5'-phosphate oxidase superfamily)
VTRTTPAPELDPRFSSAGATPTPWTEARDFLEKSEVYWLTTVRPDGRPHVTPLIAAWLNGALYFVTGPDERKAKNLAVNPHVVLTTGNNAIGEGLDLVVEGEAVPVRDEAKLQRFADALATKYGPPFIFTVRDGAFFGEGGEIYERPRLAFEVAPAAVFGFRKGASFSQTRWLF